MDRNVSRKSEQARAQRGENEEEEVTGSNGKKKAVQTRQTTRDAGKRRTRLNEDEHRGNETL